MFRRVFKAFHYRDFRILWIGACTSTIGTWMQEVAQNWLVLSLTNSPFLLGLDQFLGDIPIFLFSLWGGVLADRIDRRYILIGSQVVQMISAATLAILIWTGHIRKDTIWVVLTLSFVVGTAQAFGGPAYSALVPSLVEREDVPNAIALNSLSFLAVIISLLRLHINFSPPRTGESVMTSMKQGFTFVRAQGAMTTLILIAFLMTFLGIPTIASLPVFAKIVFGRGEMTYTWFLVASGLGSITGALMVAWLGDVHNKGRIALGALVAMGIGMVGFSQSKSILLSCVMLYFTGAMMMCAFSMISSLVQLITPNDMRGRVMSVYMMAFRGGMPFGEVATGRLVPIFTAPTVLTINGIALLSLGAYFLLVQRRVAEL